MTRKRVAGCAASLALSALAGCGTLANTTDVHFGMPPYEQPKKEPYGGVRDDAVWGAKNAVGAVTSPEVDFCRPVVFAAGLYVLAVDLPLSVVGDTLTLPYTLYVTAAEKQTRQPADNAVKPTAASQPASP